jgi:hypothetical protein
MSAPTEPSNLSNAESVGQTPAVGKVIEVEPVPLGVPIKTKRVLSEAQKAALARGREKLAEKRRLAKVEEEGSTESGSSEGEGEEEANKEPSTDRSSNEYESSQQDSWCSIM